MADQFDFTNTGGAKPIQFDTGSGFQFLIQAQQLALQKSRAALQRRQAEADFAFQEEMRPLQKQAQILRNAESVQRKKTLEAEERQRNAEAQAYEAFLLATSEMTDEEQVRFYEQTGGNLSGPGISSPPSKSGIRKGWKDLAEQRVEMGSLPWMEHTLSGKQSPVDASKALSAARRLIGQAEGRLQAIPNEDRLIEELVMSEALEPGTASAILENYSSVLSETNDVLGLGFLETDMLSGDLSKARGTQDEVASRVARAGRELQSFLGIINDPEKRPQSDSQARSYNKYFRALVGKVLTNANPVQASQSLGRALSNGGVYPEDAGIPDMLDGLWQSASIDSRYRVATAYSAIVDGRALGDAQERSQFVSELSKNPELLRGIRVMNALRAGLSNEEQAALEGGALPQFLEKLDVQFQTAIEALPKIEERFDREAKNAGMEPTQFILDRFVGHDNDFPFMGNGVLDKLDYGVDYDELSAEMQDALAEDVMIAIAAVPGGANMDTGTRVEIASGRIGLKYLPEWREGRGGITTAHPWRWRHSTLAKGREANAKQISEIANYQLKEDLIAAGYEADPADLEVQRYDYTGPDGKRAVSYNVFDPETGEIFIPGWYPDFSDAELQRIALVRDKLTLQRGGPGGAGGQTVTQYAKPRAGMVAEQILGDDAPLARRERRLIDLQGTLNRLNRDDFNDPRKMREAAQEQRRVEMKIKDLEAQLGALKNQSPTPEQLEVLKRIQGA